MAEPDPTPRRVAAATRGDPGAFEALYRELFDPVWRYVSARVGAARADVEDVVQDSFLALVRALPGYREEGRFFGFVFAIVRQRVAAWYRARGRHPEPVPDGLAEVLSREEWPDEAFQRREVRALVRRALLTLPARPREALRLKYAEGLKFRDLAVRLGISEAAAKSLVMRAKDALRTAIREEVRDDDR